MYAQQQKLHKVRRNWLRLSLSVIALLVLSSCFQVYLSYRQHLHATDQNLENLSMTLIKQVEAEFRATELALRFARDKMHQKANPDQWQSQAVYEMYRDVISTFNQAESRTSSHDLFWVDSEGLVRVTSYSNPTPEIRAEDRGYFQFHQENRSPDVLYSGSLRSRLTGRWVVYQTVRLNDAQGNFAGVVGITTRIGSFEVFHRQLNLQEDSSIILTQAGSNWSYRYPFKAEYANMNFSQSEDFERLREQGQGSTVINTSPFDQKTRRMGFYWGESMDLLGAVTISRQAVWQQFYPVLRQRGTLLLFTIMVLLISVFAYNRIYKRTGEALRLAHLDELTQIPNRRYLDDRIQQEWRSLQRSQQPLGMLFIDIDYFKKFNDEYGHQAGDRCLRKVANTIKNVLKRPDDFVARYGGEEFVVLLPGNDYEHTGQMARLILEEIRAEKFPHIDSPISSYLTVSIGYASMVPEGDDQGRQLRSLADRALYMAKNAGRDRIYGLREEPV